MRRYRILDVLVCFVVLILDTTISFGQTEKPQNRNLTISTGLLGKVEIKDSKIYNGNVYMEDTKNQEIINKQLNNITISLADLKSQMLLIKKQISAKPRSPKIRKSLDSISNVISGLTAKKDLSIKEVSGSYNKFIQIADQLLAGSSNTSQLKMELKTLRDLVIPIEKLPHNTTILSTPDNALIEVTEVKDVGIFIYPEAGGLRRFIYHNRLGFFDGKKDTVVIPPKYEAAADFSEGYAAVKSNGHIYFITPKDQPYLQKDLDQLKATEAHSFKDGYAVVRVGDKGMFYMPNRKHSILKLFDYCSDFYKGVALVKYRFEDDTTKAKRPFVFIDTLGRPLYNTNFQDAEQFNTADVAIVSQNTVTDGYSLMRRNGNVASQTKFKKIGAFSEGLAPVCPYNPSITDEITMVRLSTDKMLAKINGKVDGPEPDLTFTQFIDTAGNVVFKPDSAFSWSSAFNHKRVILRSLSQKYQLVDTNGLQIIGPAYDNIEMIADGYYVATLGNENRYYYVDGNNFAIPVKKSSL